MQYVSSGTVVEYGDWHDLIADYDDRVLDVARRMGAASVAELGGGANPILVGEGWGSVSEKVVIDISPVELGKAPDNVTKVQADLCRPLDGGSDRFDLVFSKMLCEHLPNAKPFHQNCFDMLRAGGRAMHLFPTLFALPFVANRVIPRSLSPRVLELFQPGLRHAEGNLGKFPAYYQWCDGPTPKSICRFTDLGFEVEHWCAAFGHNYYLRVSPLDRLERRKTALLLRCPIPVMTSFAAVTLRKP